ncbi:MAG: PTS sugar transporter subunit IIA [Rhabdochlamydiaceae bacterium]|nr:PTS sugar transporter subunit IIA [Candidatus Amphrikana amoebophyrae]
MVQAVYNKMENETIENSALAVETLVKFDPDLITFIDEPQSRDQVLQTLTDLLQKRKKIDNPDQFLQAIKDRESIVSTGIGLGIAIPHAKIDHYKDFFIAVAIISKKGVDWDSIDQAPVRVVFLIGGPSERQNDYLQILSTITQRIRDDEVREKLVLSHTPQAVLQQLI